MNDEEYIQLSGLQHYSLCPRRWALINIENKWTDNWRTIDGTNMHKRAHNPSANEKRGNVVTMRALKIVSRKLCLSGECDVVEFIKNEKGTELMNYDGKYLPFPIEYKRGNGKSVEADSVQLCAEAMCLEEMLLCEIPNGALFYGEIHRRFDVEFTDELRDKVVNASKEMYKLIESGHTPKAKKNAFCGQCSMKDECLPYIERRQSVENYIRKHSEEE
jgi:CRISPR-associated exonuclease Cas4